MTHPVLSGGTFGLMSGENSRGPVQTEATKVCCRCKLLQPMSAFSRLKKSPDGHGRRCRTCDGNYYAALKADPQKLNRRRAIAAERSRTAKREDPEIQRQAYQRLRKRPESLAKTQALTKVWKKNNPEKIRSYNKNYARNYKSLRNQFRRDLYKKSVLYTLECRLRSRLYRATKDQGAPKSDRTQTLIGCTLDYFASYLESKFKPGMTWENRSQWHIDHIKPLSLFDLTDPQQQQEAFHFSNLQPLWAAENIRKGARYDST